MKPKLITTIMIALFLASITVVAVPVSAKPGVIKVPDDYATIQEAIDAATTHDGDVIIVAAGEWFGAVVTKSVEIKGIGGAKIVDGPPYGPWQCGFKLETGSSGATISHFTFVEVELPIYGWDIDDVTVEHNKIYDTMQGITNWDGDNWVIKQNVIEGIVVIRNSGGIGICVGSRYSDVSGNVVAHNRIVAHIGNDRTFSVGGILLCADKRYGWTPGEVSNNKIVHNKVKITGTSSTGAGSWAIGLQVIGLSEYPPTDPDEITYATGILHDNIVGFNDLRGSDYFVECLPVELEDVNTISRNLGEDANRGHGEVPAKVFNPVN